MLSVLGNLREHLALGLGFAAIALVDPSIALWFSPITLGLLSSPWLISWTSSEALGERAQALGFFRVPPPQMGEASGPAREAETPSKPNAAERPHE